MSPGRAADILRTLIAQKGCKGALSTQDVLDAVDAAPVGTSVVVTCSGSGRYRMVKLADGWGLRQSVPAGAYRLDKHGCVPAGTLLKNADTPMGLRSPGPALCWDTIQLPADAPTAEPEVLLRRFCTAMHLHHISDDAIRAFLETP